MIQQHNDATAKDYVSKLLEYICADQDFPLISGQYERSSETDKARSNKAKAKTKRKDAGGVLVFEDTLKAYVSSACPHLLTS